ncbi:hypothetical protein GOODEAATRI_026876, partial [Goodea atripinnis]
MEYILVFYVSSVCVWFLPPLPTSGPPIVPSLSEKQNEGGYNWEVQSSARWNHLYLNTGSRFSLKISCLLYLCHSLLLSPLFFCYFLHLCWTYAGLIMLINLSDLLARHYE